MGGRDGVNHINAYFHASPLLRQDLNVLVDNMQRE